jgi:hypothetical protein
MTEQTAPRVSATAVREALTAGDNLTLVCAYEEDSKCRAAGIQEAIPLSKLRSEEAILSRDRRLVFFCA